MAKAIAIKIKEAPDVYDIATSKFFGSPTIPKEWLEENFYEDEIFFCQIKLSELAPFDKENRLPHEGYLYIFLRTNEGEYDLKPVVRYYKGEPNVVVDYFNECVDGYSHLIKDYVMEFYEVDDDDYIGTKLFGTPSDWNYSDDAPPMLMQFDPLDNETGFLDHLDGFIYFFFEKDGDLSTVFIQEEYS